MPRTIAKAEKEKEEGREPIGLGELPSEQTLSETRRGHNENKVTHLLLQTVQLE